MEFTIKMVRRKGRTLPLNYQYPLSSWIYGVIANADKAYATFLHKQGHALGNKKFKLFTFSRLMIHPYKIEEDRIVILGEEISLNIRFLVNRSMERFIRGLFMKQTFDLGDWKSRVRLEVREMTLQPGPMFLPTMKYHCISPVCVSENGHKYANYLSPDANGFGQKLLMNLHQKQIANGKRGKIENFDTTDFKLLSEPLSRLVTMKSGTSDAAKIRGYSFNFEITLPMALHKIGYYAGFGEKNSTGFGCVRALS